MGYIFCSMKYTILKKFKFVLFCILILLCMNVEVTKAQLILDPEPPPPLSSPPRCDQTAFPQCSAITTCPDGQTCQNIGDTCQCQAPPPPVPPPPPLSSSCTYNNRVNTSLNPNVCQLWKNDDGTSYCCRGTTTSSTPCRRIYVSRKTTPDFGPGPNEYEIKSRCGWSNPGSINPNSINNRIYDPFSLRSATSTRNDQQPVNSFSFTQEQENQGVIENTATRDFGGLRENDAFTACNDVCYGLSIPTGSWCHRVNFYSYTTLGSTVNVCGWADSVGRQSQYPQTTSNTSP